MGLRLQDRAPAPAFWRSWDEDLLAIELKSLLETETTLEIEITGFATTGIDRLVDPTAAPKKTDPLDELVEP